MNLKIENRDAARAAGIREAGLFQAGGTFP